MVSLYFVKPNELISIQKPTLLVSNCQYKIIQFGLGYGNECDECFTIKVEIKFSSLNFIVKSWTFSLQNFTVEIFLLQCQFSTLTQTASNQLTFTQYSSVTSVTVTIDRLIIHIWLSCDYFDPLRVVMIRPVRRLSTTQICLWCLMIRPTRDIQKMILEQWSSTTHLTLSDIPAVDGYGLAGVRW